MQTEMAAGLNLQVEQEYSTRALYSGRSCPSKTHTPHPTQPNPLLLNSEKRGVSRNLGLNKCPRIIILLWELILPWVPETGFLWKVEKSRHREGFLGSLKDIDTDRKDSKKQPPLSSSFAPAASHTSLMIFSKKNSPVINEVNILLFPFDS